MPLVPLIGWIVLAIAVIGGLYAVAASALTERLMTGNCAVLNSAPAPVTILKPLYGAEPGLEAALATMLMQDYPAEAQIVFGLHGADDPAMAVAQRLKDRFPAAAIDIVCNPAMHGSNGKISNLINMMAVARHETLVLSDSDIAAPKDWLAKVVAALEPSGVGAVSCLYAGEGRAGFWSELGAMAVAYQFLPNAALGIEFHLANPCFGSTIALRRRTLDAIGGFATFANLLADDFEIGRAVRKLGLKIAYPALTVMHYGDEASLPALLAHELRWARTVRVIDPLGHWGSFVTHAIPLGLIGATLTGFDPTALAELATIFAARLFLKTKIDHIVGCKAGPLWALPLRDVLSFAVYLVSLSGTAVRWRGARLRVARDGAMS